MDRRLFFGVAAATATVVLSPLAARGDEMPKSWDGLVLVKSKKLEAVYLLPGADFAPYDKVLLGPTEVAFAKDWVQNYNMQADFNHRLAPSDAQRIMTAVRTGFQSIFSKAFIKAGYHVVDVPAKDVLRLNSAVFNLALTAPDTEADFSSTYGGSAGQATMILEARDSLTGALLGRALDAEVAGNFWQQLNQMTNTSDFTQVGDQWASASVKGFEKLRASSPFEPPGTTAKAAATAGKPAAAKQ
jgi:Protein of unknown function (DUF3313)